MNSQYSVCNSLFYLWSQKIQNLITCKTMQTYIVHARSHIVQKWLVFYNELLFSFFAWTTFRKPCVQTDTVLEIRCHKGPPYRHRTGKGTLTFWPYVWGKNLLETHRWIPNALLAPIGLNHKTPGNVKTIDWVKTMLPVFLYLQTWNTWVPNYKENEQKGSIDKTKKLELKGRSTCEKFDVKSLSSN